MIRWSPVAPVRTACPHNRLSRLLGAQLPDGITVGASTLRAWASASFVGARHIFPCTGNVSLPALQERLAAVEWKLPGQIVADLVVEREERDGGDFRIEILTVED